MTDMMFFVGVGGSGAKTLAYLHQRLGDWALSRGWDRPLPNGWQFLALDLPKTLDDATKIGHQLPANSYKGIAPDQRTYVSYDTRLASSGHAEVRREFATWRPDPGKVDQSVHKGAGQYRAIGRTVVIESFDVVAKSVQGCVDTLSSAETEQDFQQFLTAVGLPPHAGSAAPLVFVVGSVAGGSGSGTVLDVCDVIRAMGQEGDLWLQDVSGILYMPEVFNRLGRSDIRGIEANSLAAVHELVSARYNGTVPLPHLLAAGIGGRPSVSRGPRYPFFVGRTNGVFTYPNDHSVYAGTARLLEALTVDAALQNAFSSATQGNFAQSETILETNPLRPANTAKPASALGYARLSLGREVFARYVSERVSKTLVEHLLNQHKVLAASALGGEEDVASFDRARLVKAIVTEDMERAFREAAQLNEFSPANNQVLERLLPPDIRSGLVQKTAAAVKKATRGGQRGEHDGADWFTRFETQLGIHEATFLSEVDEVLTANAGALVGELPDKLLEATRSSLAAHGLFVTEELLRRLDANLRFVVEQELPAERTTLSTGAEGLLGDVKAALKGLLSRAIKFDQPDLQKAFDDVLMGRPDRKAKALARSVAIPLLRDLRVAVLGPLLAAMTAAREELTAFSTTTEYEGWSWREVPERLELADNDIAVEPTDGYPEAYERLVRQAVGTEGDPTRLIVEQLLDDADLPKRDRTRLALLGLTSWTPDRREDRLGATVRFMPQALLERASAWAVADPTSGLGAHLTESIGSYLAGANLGVNERKARIDTFARELDRAIRAAQPLVDIDVDALGTLHDESLEDGLPPAKLAITPIPIPAGNEHARRAVDAVLMTYGVPQDALDACYSVDGGATAIAITTQAQPCHPLAIRSFTSPIRQKWLSTPNPPVIFGLRRRARRVVESVPLPLPSIEDIVSGWFAGSLIGLAGYDGKENVNGELVSFDTVWVLEKDGTEIALPTFGPEGPPKGEDDVLPMLLDAYGITELLEVTGHPTATTAGYRRLAELAGLVEVREWVEKGTIGGRAFDIDLVGDESDAPHLRRADTLCADLDSYIAEYRSLVEEEPSTAFVAMTRRWDLASLLLDVTRSMRARVEAFGRVQVGPQRRRRVGA